MVTAEAHNAAAAGPVATGRRQRQPQLRRTAVRPLTARRRFRPADPPAPGWGKWQPSESGAAIMPQPERRA